MNFIPLMVPSLQEEDIQAAVKVMRSGMLVQGKEVEALENKIETKLGVRNAIAASNGTATLHMALVALGIGKGDEVIVPAFSYTATANVVELVGAKPVFADIDTKDFNINPQAIHPLISRNTKAIIPVHEFGLACDIASIRQIASDHHLFVIEDAACALGAQQNNCHAGNFGDFGSFSFHPRKAITSGEGGMLTTNNEQLAEKIRILRNHGIQYNNAKMDFVEAGFNYRMTDFQAAMVASGMDRLDEIIQTKQALAEIYFEFLDHPLVEVPSVPKYRNHTWQTFHILLHERINREKIIEAMKVQGIGVNYGAQCIPAQTYYKNKYKLNSKELYPNAFRSYQQGLALPLYERLKKEDILRIIQSLSNAISNQC